MSSVPHFLVVVYKEHFKFLACSQPHYFAICHFQCLQGYFHSITLALANSLYKQKINPNYQSHDIGKIINENDKANSCNVLLSPPVIE